MAACKICLPFWKSMGVLCHVGVALVPYHLPLYTLIPLILAHFLWNLHYLKLTAKSEKFNLNIVLPFHKQTGRAENLRSTLGISGHWAVMILYIVQHLLWNGTSTFKISLIVFTNLVSFYDKPRILRTVYTMLRKPHTTDNFDARKPMV